MGTTGQEHHNMQNAITEREVGELIASLRSLNSNLDHLRISLDRIDARVAKVEHLEYRLQEVEDLEPCIKQLKEHYLTTKGQRTMLAWIPTILSTVLTAMVLMDKI